MFTLSDIFVLAAQFFDAKTLEAKATLRETQQAILTAVCHEVKTNPFIDALLKLDPFFWALRAEVIRIQVAESAHQELKRDQGVHGIHTLQREEVVAFLHERYPDSQFTPALTIEKIKQWPIIQSDSKLNAYLTRVLQGALFQKILHCFDEYQAISALMGVLVESAQETSCVKGVQERLLDTLYLVLGLEQKTPADEYLLSILTPFSNGDRTPNMLYQACVFQTLCRHHNVTVEAVPESYFDQAFLINGLPIARYFSEHDAVQPSEEELVESLSLSVEKKQRLFRQHFVSCYQQNEQLRENLHAEWLVLWRDIEDLPLANSVLTPQQCVKKMELFKKFFGYQNAFLESDEKIKKIVLLKQDKEAFKKYQSNWVKSKIKALALQHASISLMHTSQKALDENMANAQSRHLLARTLESFPGFTTQRIEKRQHKIKVIFQETAETKVYDDVEAFIAEYVEPEDKQARDETRKTLEQALHESLCEEQAWSSFTANRALCYPQGGFEAAFGTLIEYFRGDTDRLIHFFENAKTYKQGLELAKKEEDIAARIYLFRWIEAVKCHKTFVLHLENVIGNPLLLSQFIRVFHDPVFLEPSLSKDLSSVLSNPLFRLGVAIFLGDLPYLQAKVDFCRQLTISRILFDLSIDFEQAEIFEWLLTIQPELLSQRVLYVHLIARKKLQFLQLMLSRENAPLLKKEELELLLKVLAGQNKKSRNDILCFVAKAEEPVDFLGYALQENWWDLFQLLIERISDLETLKKGLGAPQDFVTKLLTYPITLCPFIPFLESHPEKQVLFASYFLECNMEQQLPVTIYVSLLKLPHFLVSVLQNTRNLRLTVLFDSKPTPDFLVNVLKIVLERKRIQLTDQEVNDEEWSEYENILANPFAMQMILQDKQLCFMFLYVSVQLGKVDALEGHKITVHQLTEEQRCRLCQVSINAQQADVLQWWLTTHPELKSGIRKIDCLSVVRGGDINFLKVVVESGMHQQSIKNLLSHALLTDHHEIVQYLFGLSTEVCEVSDIEAVFTYAFQNQQWELLEEVLAWLACRPDNKDFFTACGPLLYQERCNKSTYTKKLNNLLEFLENNPEKKACFIDYLVCHYEFLFNESSLEKDRYPLLIKKLLLSLPTLPNPVLCKHFSSACRHALLIIVRLDNSEFPLALLRSFFNPKIQPILWSDEFGYFRSRLIRDAFCANDEPLILCFLQNFPASDFDQFAEWAVEKNLPIIFKAAFAKALESSALNEEKIEIKKRAIRYAILKNKNFLDIVEEIYQADHGLCENVLWNNEWLDFYLCEILDKIFINPNPAYVNYLVAFLERIPVKFSFAQEDYAKKIVVMATKIANPALIQFVLKRIEDEPNLSPRKRQQILSVKNEDGETLIGVLINKINPNPLLFNNDFQIKESLKHIVASCNKIGLTRRELLYPSFWAKTRAILSRLCRRAYRKPESVWNKIRRIMKKNPISIIVNLLELNIPITMSEAWIIDEAIKTYNQPLLQAVSKNLQNHPNRYHRLLWCAFHKNVNLLLKRVLSRHSSDHQGISLIIPHLIEHSTSADWMKKDNDGNNTFWQIIKLLKELPFKESTKEIINQLKAKINTFSSSKQHKIYNQQGNRFGEILSTWIDTINGLPLNQPIAVIEPNDAGLSRQQTRNGLPPDQPIAVIDRKDAGLSRRQTRHKPLFSEENQPRSVCTPDRPHYSVAKALARPQY